MLRKDLLKYDASDQANMELEHVIKGRKNSNAKPEKTLSVDEAMSGKRLFSSNDSRNVTRVLFISKDAELLNPSQQSLDGYLNIADLFAEVHILILRPGIKTSKPVLRISPSVWLYTATAGVWWMTPAAGIKLAKEQLEFVNGFRPDLIVARDPFESAVVATSLSKRYGKPAQLHIMEDFTKTKFLAKNKNNFWRKLLTHFTISEFSSIRTVTKNIKGIIQKKSLAPDIKELPRYHNYEALIDVESKVDLKDVYKPLVFFMIYAGRLDRVEDVFLVMDATRSILTNPRLGLIILGDGRERNAIKKRARLLGIEAQVIVESRDVDLASYLKSSHIMLVSQTDNESEELVIKAAASGVPMVMAKTERREDLFKDGEDAFLCEPNNKEDFCKKTHELLDNVGLRNQFVKNSQQVVRSRFHSDKKEYRTLYRESIEEALFVEE